MSEIKENKVEETGEKIEALNLDAVDAPAGKMKKALKWVIGAVALVATGITGFILGKATGDHDDDSNEETTEETA